MLQSLIIIIIISVLLECPFVQFAHFDHLTQMKNVQDPCWGALVLFCSSCVQLLVRKKKKELLQIIIG